MGEPVWRKTGDGHGVTLAITEQGLAAGIAGIAHLLHDPP